MVDDDGRYNGSALPEYLLAHDERFVFPVPAYAEPLVGEGNAPDGDVAAA